MATTYRMYTDDDIDDLVKFWSDNSGWDQIDRTEWERRFHHTPYGKATVALAIKKKEIVGQFVFIPTVISIDGKEVKAFRPFAPVVKESLRSALGMATLIEIIFKMYNYAIDHFRLKGISLVHMLPDPRWVRGFRFLSDIQIGDFPLWSIPLPTKEKFVLPDGYEVEPINATDEKIDLLWAKNSRLYGCSLPRNTQTLSWKTSHGDYKLVGIFYQGELVGLSTSTVKEKDKQWLICDMISSDGDETLLAIIKATCNAAHDFVTSQTGTAVEKAAILATALIEKNIKQLGFKKEKYKFPIVVQLLDPKLSKQQVAPERWYASAND